MYPKKDKKDDASHTRIGFRVNDVDAVVKVLRDLQAVVVTEPTDTEWGRRAVVKNFDGHTVELVAPWLTL